MSWRSVEPGWPGDEHGLVGGRAVEVDRQMLRRRGRTAVLVGAQQREVEAPARKLEVVRVAAERGDVGLGREDQPHVVVAPILIEPELAAAVERDGLAFQWVAGGS